MITKLCFLKCYKKGTMAPHMETEPNEDEPQNDRLKPFTADNHKFKINMVEFPFLTAYSMAGFYGCYVFLTQPKLATIIYIFWMIQLSVLSLTAGVHRLWSHRSYKPKPPLEIFLLFLYIMAHQRSVIRWARGHRLHHKYSDTDADPHNATRGFFFSHFGWLLVLPHPEMEKRLKLIDVSDLWNNPYVRFQQNYYVPLVLVIAYAMPTYIPTLWGESLYVAFWTNFFRIFVVLNLIGLINSVGHLMGYRPIDATVPGTQFPFMCHATSGEGYHNYHHCFPVDYKTSELGDSKYNITSKFIEFMAKIGMAHDLKTTSEEVVRARVLAKGDGTDRYHIPNNENKQKFFCTKLFKNVDKCT